mmetsp:Transcript_40945/g.96165  ORF Transcript_40945/g.96165 Transcript_40945/m.96165 type:complete len:166 (+) Transcript_40945:79-576(+)|eukprot:CAMPEP_0178401690 /NCGR_PEP_ID=MMETSP0689_2-20121128/16434_1 /TAXON_ID=160604 /ORGANISM="Amphidinium massartii, Strain CS-259" /LENGTH=165 /DNA_ID=CAMNT_0020022523 /DNA_START=78 /DNA_END=575 /DNA_ORIENTATION=+
MQRLVSAVALASCALLGAQCFLMPTSQSSSALSSPAQASAKQLGQVNTESSASSSWSPLAFGAALGVFAAVATARPVLAADLENGESIFTGNCAACHAGGNNTVVPEKKLKKDALIAYDKFGVDKIITQVTNGNGKMPAFGDKLAPDDIEDVANYVYDQASGNKW